MNNTRLC